jgi:integrase
MLIHDSWSYPGLPRHSETLVAQGALPSWTFPNSSGNGCSVLTDVLTGSRQGNTRTVAMAKITKETVDALKPKQSPDGSNADGYLWDAELKGFGCKATPAGSKVFLVQYRLGGRAGKTQRVTLGRFGDLTPAEARTRAKCVLGGIAAEKDPAAEMRENKKKLAGGTFEEICERFIAARKKPGRYWQENQRLMANKAYPVLGTKLFSAVTRADITLLLDKASEPSSRAKSGALSNGRKLFAVICQIFPWAMDRGIIEHNPIAGLKPPSAVTRRKRTLSLEELRVFWAATGEMPWPFGPYFRLLLLTGQRLNEVAGLRWDEIDQRAGIWRLPSAEEFQPPRTKNGQEHSLDLPEQALAILGALPSGKHALAFTTTGKTAITGFSKAKRRLDALMASKLGREVKPWRLHDLRRTMATLMGEELDIDQGVIERILNHTSGTQGGLMGIYQRQEYRTKRKAAMTAWGAFVEELTADNQPCLKSITYCKSPVPLP